MSATVDAFLRSWPFDPWLLIALVVCAGIYLRGWLALRRRDSRRWHGGQVAAFLGGLAAIYLALASPIEPFAAFLARFRSHLGLVEKAMGGLLVLTGIAFLTGAVSEVGYWLLDTFPMLGKIG